MSRELALDTIYLRPTSRLAHTDYSLSYHAEYIREKTGLDPASHEAQQRFNEFWGMDFLWGTNDGLHANWGVRGRVTDMGHAVYADGNGARQRLRDGGGGVVLRCRLRCGLRVRCRKCLAAHPECPAGAADQLTAGGYYGTIISGAIAAFGWRCCCSVPPIRPGWSLSLTLLPLYAPSHGGLGKTSVEVVISMMISSGPEGAFMHRISTARSHPRRGLWNRCMPPAKSSSARMATTPSSRRDRQAGADGLIFEPFVDFGWAAGALAARTAWSGVSPIAATWLSARGIRCARRWTAPSRRRASARG